MIEFGDEDEEEYDAFSSLNLKRLIAQFPNIEYLNLDDAI